MKNYFYYLIKEFRKRNNGYGETLLQQKFFLLSFLFLFSISSYAQNTRAITGMVNDTLGQPLSGVTIITDVSKKTVVSDQNGNYSIQVTPADKKLTFSFVGLKQFSQPLTGQSAYGIIMTPDNTGLSDVVVIGYGTQKKEALTGSIATVTAKDLDRVHGGSTVSTGLAGKLPGVTFRMPDGRPGASATIQIRNMGTPLYVIDGIQQDEGQFNNLAPNDIESISVL